MLYISHVKIIMDTILQPCLHPQLHIQAAMSKQVVI